MRVLVATDAWHPQVNGVVRTYERLAIEAGKLGFEIVFLTPSDFRTLPCPTYPEIRLALAGPRAIAAHIAKAKPDFIHIATEGPIGLMTRRYCRKTKWPFTTSYHTRFPEYVSARLPVPESWCYALQRRFHNGAAGTFVATQSIEDELHARGFERLMRWSRGVDTELFRPRKSTPLRQEAGIPLCRPHRGREEHQGLPRRRPSRPQGAGWKRAASRRARAASSGRAVRRADGGRGAGARLCLGRRLRVSEPHRHVRPGAARGAGERRAGGGISGARAQGRAHRPLSGAMDWDLKAAMAKALTLDRHAARAHALRYSWENSARQFIDNVLIAHHRKLPERRRRWRRNRQKKAARLGGNRAASLSCVSLGDAWGISRPPRDG